MLSTFQHPHRSFRTRALAIIGAALVLAIVSQLAVRLVPAAPIAKPAAVASAPADDR